MQEYAWNSLDLEDYWDCYEAKAYQSFEGPPGAENSAAVKRD